MSIKSSNNKKNNSLLNLCVAALALPGMSVQATEVVSDTTFGYRYNVYQEDDISEESKQSGDSERYEINAHQFSLVAPINDQVQVNLSFQTESMTGASPWYTAKEDGKPVQVMSGATIEDDRQDYSIGAKFADGVNAFSGTFAQSKENDYESTSFGAGYERDLNNKQANFSFAFDMSNDDINPTDAKLYDRPENETKDSWSIFTAYSHLVDKNTLLLYGIGIMNKKGYLSDPYKLVIVENSVSDNVLDTRPDERQAYTFTTRLRHYVDGVSGAVHLDYRYYDDDWNINSHTIDLAWYQNLPDNWQVVPSLRYYSQSEAFFYEPYYEFERNDGLQSTDARLSAYGAYTYGIKINKKFDQFNFTVSYQRYKSDGGAGLGDSFSENPGLVDFTLISTGLNYRF